MPMKKPSKQSISKKVPVASSAASDVTQKAVSRARSRSVGLKDIAAVVGVSMQTVSYALNGTGSVSEELRGRVREIARKMGYRPNRSAKAMRTGRSNTIGLVITDMSNPFYAELAQEVERAAASARFAVLLIDAQGDQVASPETIERIETLPSHPVDGVISTVMFKSIMSLNVPVVIFGGPVPRHDSVGMDDTTDQIVLIEHLLALGHRRFALVNSPRPGGVGPRREVSLDRISQDAAVLWEYTTPPDERADDDVLPYLERREATAIVCSNDTVAISVQSQLRKLGISVPDEVSVVGYDGIAWGAIATPGITTMRMPFPSIGQAAVQLLNDRLQTPSRRAKSIRFHATLVERESTAPPPKPVSSP
jgi:LacI family transcriptional regulator